MFDDIHSEDGLPLDGRKRAPQPDADRPVADREVPLPASSSRTLSPAVHAWLDGELPEAALRDLENQRDIEFWKRLAAETEHRRHVSAPVALEQRIMASLPQTAPQVITPWYRREFVVTPAVAIGIAAALVLMASAVTALVLLLTR